MACVAINRLAVASCSKREGRFAHNRGPIITIRVTPDTINLDREVSKMPKERGKTLPADLRRRLPSR